MARTDGAETRHHTLYLEIRRNLLRGSFPAGHRFKLSKLSSELGVSVTVAREALTRLSEQGLVVLEPNKGFSVPDFTDAEINDVAFVRKEIESIAVRRSIEQGGIEWEARVVAAHHQLAVSPNAALDEDPEANEAWTNAHRAFHEVCAAACGSPRLLAFRIQLYDQSEIIRQMAKLHRGRQRDVAGEHAAIAEAVVARNADKAVQLLHTHIERTRLSCLESWAAAQPPG
ncbi:GntR family transcriptional regulator [Streptomyces phyllanthi]|uniref:GntR family transcriptional regulator n=1 Tax=Streptomyces phyllanthi TaxID=1803180 RepID=A0A5N8W862_9ACTN|nr:GntR family transcriptional regulator [Streptomyces phyllanthi]MPY43661.1 GntR family transcriptional regulator [Streptomyces phyllanthi]